MDISDKRGYRYVALSQTVDMGRFVLYMGTLRETREDVTRHALGMIDTQDMLSSEWAREARANLRVLSITNARRMYSRTIREYERLAGGMV